MRWPASPSPRASVYLLLALCLGLSLSLSVTPAAAQTTSSGTVAGVVTDSTGAIVVGANVALIDLSTNNARASHTNEAGRYVFVSVPPGTYDITVTQTGFAVARARQNVSVGMLATVNISLKVGSATQEVKVEATGVELQTMSSTVGTTMGFDMAQAMPGLTRDVSGLAMLQPATTPASGTSGVAGATAGSNADQNKYMLDGGNNSGDMDGTNSVYNYGFAGNPITGSGSAIPNGVVPTPVESIEEFKVGVVGIEADFASASGNQVSMVTRRGTDAVHGSVYDYYYGTNFSANNWANGHTPSTDPKTGLKRGYTPLPSRHENRFGASAGGPVAPKFLGGKTYLFGFYQGERYPNMTTVERLTPSAMLRAGVMQVQNNSSGAITLNGVSYAKGAWMPFNLNPVPVTVGGVTYQAANVCNAPGGLVNQPCDPRGVGLNSVVNQIWSQWMPTANDPASGDNYNTMGYQSTISLPQKSDNWAFRLDHDFGSKWHLFTSYRMYRFINSDTSQLDVGGILGAAKGTYSALKKYPVNGRFFVAGLTTTLTSHLTNDFRYSYTYDWWKWNGPEAPPQPIAGLGGAVEIGGESINALIPYNVNTQQARTRFWDGQDHFLRDDVSWLHGNHLINIGGSYQRNFNWHDRNDNGQGIMAAAVYQVTNASGGINWNSYLPPSSILATSGMISSYETMAAYVLGLVDQPQTMYTRGGSDLHLLPFGTHAQDKDIIPFYDLHFSDSWRIKPSFTLTFGLTYNLEMPPKEEQGRQVMLVDQAGIPVSNADYFARRDALALQGKVYDPVLGFAIVPNVGSGRKYPFDPFYGGLGPRVAAAWNPKFDSGILGKLLGNGNTVIRGGYSRIYGRLNGVNLVLVPLLGTGLMQAVSCVGAVAPAYAVGGSQCLGINGADPKTAFRIGSGPNADGLTAPLGNPPSATLAQPYFPGVGGNLTAAAGSGLDPKTRPNSNDAFTFSIQRQVSSKIFVEAGYIGKLIHNEFQQSNVDAVPWMLTLGGQTFAQAYANLFTALCGVNIQTCTVPSTLPTVAAQPFFEAAMGGPTSTYCTGSANCTAAVLKNQKTYISTGSVYQLWSALSGSSSWTPGLTNPGMNPPGGCPTVKTPTTVCRQLAAFEFIGSNGWGNYHGLYGTVTLRDWHGVTSRSNFTWGRALGTGSEVQARSTRTVLNPYDLQGSYGPQQFDVKFVFNTALNYKIPFYSNQKGIVGRVLGGWSLAPIFTAQSGFPLRVTQDNGNQVFGQSDPSQGTIYNVVPNGSLPSGSGALHYINTKPGGGIGDTATMKDVNGNATQWLNYFADPSAAITQFRRLILGVDQRGNGWGILRGFRRWNMDMTIAKDIRATERVGVTFIMLTTNIFNHYQPTDPSLALDSPATFGRVNDQQYDSRQIEFGLKVRF